LPAVLDANARTLNAKIISNAAFRYLCFLALAGIRPWIDTAKRDGACCIMLRGRKDGIENSGWNQKQLA